MISIVKIILFFTNLDFIIYYVKCKHLIETSCLLCILKCYFNIMYVHRFTIKMTSMFDQYEQASQRSKQVLAPPIRPDIVCFLPDIN